MPTAAPRFYIYPPRTEQYISYLAKCAEHKLTATGFGPHGPAPWSRFLPRGTDWVSGWALQLANPLAHDTHGGIGAELLACQTAATHPQRTHEIEQADVIFVCALFYYSLEVGDCGGGGGGVKLRGRDVDRATIMRPPPHTIADRNATRQRGEALAQMLTRFGVDHRSVIKAWKVTKPTIFLGATEYADLAYDAAGRPFGRPPPPFVLQANPSHWGLGIAQDHAIIPYMPSPALLTPMARASTDSGIDGPAREHLLFFRGSIAIGAFTRAPLMSLAGNGVRVEATASMESDGGASVGGYPHVRARTRGST